VDLPLPFSPLLFPEGGLCNRGRIGRGRLNAYACSQVTKLGFPSNIAHFADTFARLQDSRHRADYDPHAQFNRAEVLLMISEADRAIRVLNHVSLSDRKAFAALVLLKNRRR